MNLTILGWYDPFELLCSLRPRLPLFKGDGGVRVLTLRGPRPQADPDDVAAYVNTKEQVKWTEAKRLIAWLKRGAEERIAAETEFGRIFFEMMEPGQARLRRPELSDYTQDHSRLVYVCRTNPATNLQSGAEVVQTSVAGQVILQQTRAWHGAVNAGEVLRINLLVDIRKSIRVEANDLEHTTPVSGEADGRL